MGAVLSTLHVKVKFPIEWGVAMVRGSQQVAKQCLVVAVDKRKGQTGMNGSIEEVPS